MNYFSPIVAALITVLAITIILSGRFGNRIHDVPNERSLHSTPVSRIGGIGLLAGILAGWVLMFTVLVWWLLVPLIGLFIVSLFDDMHSLSVRWRLSVHLIAAAILVSGSGLLFTQGNVVALAVLLLTVWMTNLYNFMDGSDGLAGGMALFGFAFYGIAAYIAHVDTLAMLNFCISAAALGFLIFNFNPAKIFMGDSGSIPLGFLVAAMGLWGWQQGCWGTWFPLLVFSPFIVDASVTLMKRTLRGVRISEAHREHYYQHAILLGWSHRNVALVEYALMIGSGFTALLVLKQIVPWQVFFICIGVYAVLMLFLDVAWKKFEREQHA